MYTEIDVASAAFGSLTYAPISLSQIATKVFGAQPTSNQKLLLTRRLNELIHKGTVSKNKRKYSRNLSVFQTNMKRITESHLCSLPSIQQETCSFCSAIYYHPYSSKYSRTPCCKNGSKMLSFWPDPVPIIHSLFNGENRLSRTFAERITAFNSALKMLSFGARQIDRGIPGVPCVKIRGELMHRTGSILPLNEDSPYFMNLWFYDPSSALRKRKEICHFDDTWESDTLELLTDALRTHHTLFKCIKNQVELAQEYQWEEYSIHLIHSHKTKSNHTLPLTQEVAALINNEMCEQSNYFSRDIIIHYKHHVPHRVHEFHKQYDCLAYPILFSTGHSTFEDGMKWINSSSTVSFSDYYKWHSYERVGQANLHLRANRLTQWWVIDVFLRLERSRLRYHYTLDKQFRKTNKQQFIQSYTSKSDMNKVGKRVILGPTFVGGPRYFARKVREGHAYATAFGKPDLFITMTLNTNDPDIKSRIGKSPTNNHPFVISQIFFEKVKVLKELLFNYNVLGRVAAWMYSIEWQKRLTPHIHLLLWLIMPDKIITAADVDRVISARIPDPDSQPELYKLVTSLHLHHKCGKHGSSDKCLLPYTNKCGSRFPKPFSHETRVSSSSYPTYQRLSPLDGGHTFTDARANIYDDQWVSPYNPALLYYFKSHINVEVCLSIQGVKYINKYINKGQTRIKYNLKKDVDEIAHFAESRYVNAMEGAWRLLGYPYCERYPAVYLLDLHLENEQTIYFDSASVNEDQFKQICTDSTSKLLQWFALNVRESHQPDSLSHSLLYSEIGLHYCWSNNEWKKRKNRSNTVSRIYPVLPNQGELFYMRLLLGYVKGCMNHRDIRTFEGHVYSTYKEAAEARGLLLNRVTWNAALKEVFYVKGSAQMIRLFATILLTNHKLNGQKIWKELLSFFIADKVHSQIKSNRAENRDLAESECLNELQILLRAGNKTLGDYGLTQPCSVSNPLLNTHILSDMQLQSVGAEFHSMYALLNSDQKRVFHRITDSDDPDNRLHIVKAMGGTGKTFLEKCLLQYYRSRGVIALSMASTGIAASLIANSTTVHTGFKVPIHTAHDSMCDFSHTLNKHVTDLLKHTQVIFIDEAFVIHKYVWDAISRTLCDVFDSSEVFAGKKIILFGDSQQTSVVVPKGDECDIIRYSLQKWRHFHKFKPNIHTLNLNMRIELSRSNDNFEKLCYWDDFLKQIGQDTIAKFRSIHPCAFEVPSEMVVRSQSIQELIDFVYPNFVANYKSAHYLSERNIITPLNTTVNSINEVMHEIMPGHERVFTAADSFCNDSDNALWSLEFLKNNYFTGLPPHFLKLKKGSLVMCLRNINPAVGLTNGTKLQVRGFLNNTLECMILTGANRGAIVNIPRIDFLSDITKHPVSFRRRQYPLSLCYGMTINKSQGQTIERLGIYLPNPVFSHGQLYTAISRTGNPDNVKILIEQSECQGRFIINGIEKWLTLNVVSKPIL